MPTPTLWIWTEQAVRGGSTKARRSFRPTRPTLFARSRACASPSITRRARIRSASRAAVLEARPSRRTHRSRRHRLRLRRRCRRRRRLPILQHPRRQCSAVTTTQLASRKARPATVSTSTTLTEPAACSSRVCRRIRADASASKTKRRLTTTWLVASTRPPK